MPHIDGREVKTHTSWPRDPTQPLCGTRFAYFVSNTSTPTCRACQNALKRRALKRRAKYPKGATS